MIFCQILSILKIICNQYVKSIIKIPKLKTVILLCRLFFRLINDHQLNFLHHESHFPVEEFI